MRPQDVAIELVVATRQMDLDRRDLGPPLEDARHVHVLLQRTAADRDDDPRTAPGESQQLAGHERIQARVLQSRLPDDPRGRFGDPGHVGADALRDRDGPRHDRSDPAQVDQTDELATGAPAAGGDHHRGREDDPSEVDGEGSSRGHGSPPPCGMAGTGSAVGGTIGSSPSHRSHRIRDGSNTGPSTHARRFSYAERSFVATGTTQVLQSPNPHPIRSSIATCAGSRCSRQNAAIDLSVGAGATAYTTSASARATASGNASRMPPRSPRDPSAVITTTVWERRLASTGLKTLSRVRPPRIMSTRLCRATSSCARKKREAAPRPSATRRQFVRRFGYENALPSGPITSRNSWALAAASQPVPAPDDGSTTKSSVPAHPPRREAWWIEKWRRRMNERP